MGTGRGRSAKCKTTLKTRKSGYCNLSAHQRHDLLPLHQLLHHQISKPLNLVADRVWPAGCCCCCPDLTWSGPVCNCCSTFECVLYPPPSTTIAPGQPPPCHPTAPHFGRLYLLPKVAGVVGRLLSLRSIFMLQPFFRDTATKKK